MKRPKEERLSQARVAKDFGVSPQTLNDHVLKKHITQKDYHASRQLLSMKQEDELVHAIQLLDSRGMPVERRDAERMANEIINCGHRGGKQHICDGWFKRFLVRHHAMLSGRWSSPLDKNRADGLNETTAKQHFDLVEETGKEFAIVPELDFGFDESPFMMGIAPKRRVYGRRVNKSGKRVKQSQTESCEAGRKSGVVDSCRIYLR